jgi:hypothetical protein
MIDTLEGECCVEDALRMEAWKSCRMQACAEEARGQLPTQMANGVIVRILPFGGNTPPLSKWLLH